MNSIIRFSGVVNKVSSGNPLDCLEETGQILAELGDGAGDIILLPRLSLCSPSCGNLFSNPMIADQCAEALAGLQKISHNHSGYVIAGLALDDYGRAVSAMAVLHRGGLVGLIPTLDNPAPFINKGFSQQLLPVDSVFSCGGLRFCVMGCGLGNLTLRASSVAASGCDLILVPAFSHVHAGLIDEVCDAARVTSQAVGCAVAIVNGGAGATSSPYLYNGFIAVYECGSELVLKKGANQSFFTSADLDVDIIRAGKKLSSFTPPAHSIPADESRRGLLRNISKTPFLPETGRDEYLSELFAYQARSLAARMENVGIQRLVVGVSGGLDSTAALLACAAATDLLGLPRGNILGITMPGFGTTDRTYYNALSLMESLGTSRRDISIKQSVQQHFEDIGHSGKRDITYENAQARERAQILLDIANMTSGLVVGTGDLSEEALGWCTFAGDHIAGYNVNVCITKTVLRALMRHIADNNVVEGASEVLCDILDTPVSPELLPPSDSGSIVQKTEDILGPYELHDFFLYYFVKYRMRPAKIYYYACIAFAGEFEPKFIKDTLSVFFKRFAAGQFKRACAPDSASITEVNLSGVHYYIPSDLDPSALLRELEEIVL